MRFVVSRPMHWACGLLMLGLSGCGPVTAVALLQNNTGFLDLVRAPNAEGDSEGEIAQDTPKEKRSDIDG